jgi:hypothetical protein
MAVKNENLILSARVYHRRLLPKVNSFNYRAYYIALDMDNKLSTSKLFSINKWNVFSFYDKNYGYHKSQDSKQWFSDLLDKENINFDKTSIITMPKILGYLFNPISFWLAYKNGILVVVIAEVNNTFGETHSYICHKNNQEITNSDWFEAEKVFHVSPFFDRIGYYKFNFKISLKENTKNIININYFNNDNQLLLATSINGTMTKLTSLNLVKQFIRSPLLTFKVITLIHIQALKLFIRKIGYRNKPLQKDIKITIAKFITKS